MKDFVKIANGMLIAHIHGEQKQVPLSAIKRIDVNYSGVGQFFAAWSMEVGDDVIIWDNHTRGARDVAEDLQRHLTGFDLARISRHIQTAPREGIVQVWPQIVQQKIHQQKRPVGEAIANGITDKDRERLYAGLRRIRTIRDWQYTYRMHFIIVWVAIMIVAELITVLALLALVVAFWYGYLRLYYLKCPRCGRLYHNPWSLNWEYHYSKIWGDSNSCVHCGLAMSELPELNKPPRTIFG